MTSPILYEGPVDAPTYIVGEAPGEEEVRHRRPFIGTSGLILTEILSDLGIPRRSCRIANVCGERPPRNKIKNFFHTKTEAKKLRIPEIAGRYPAEPVAQGRDRLLFDIASHPRRLIIALGDTALWALTGESGIGKWRGSFLEFQGAHLTPTWHPAAISRDWALRATALHDLRRGLRQAGLASSPPVPKPDYDFLLRPSWAEARDWLDILTAVADRGPLPLAVDLETFGGQIECIGIATGPRTAACIPLIELGRPGNAYWSAPAELEIILRLRKLFYHPNVRILGQNYNYDAQHTAAQWGFVGNFSFDTMIAQGVLWPGTPKGLDYLSSLYAKYHVYWKDEGKVSNMTIAPEIRWEYNCKDAVVTWEVAQVLNSLLDKMNQREQYNQTFRTSQSMFRAMLRGVRIDPIVRHDMGLDLQAQMGEIGQWLDYIFPTQEYFPGAKGSPWYNSPKKTAELFYRRLGLKPIFNRQSGNLTADDEAIARIAKREPLLRPITDLLTHYRSCSVFLNTFIKARLGTDERLRCSYNVVGTETLRFNSSKDAFGSGTNLQNIPKGNEKQI